MLTRRLGRTGHHVSLAVLGGAAFARATPDEAALVFEAALAAGVNQLDIAPTYGLAEQVVGPLVPSVRDRLFVACKTGRANPDGVRAQLEASLARLGTDHFDLYQAHGVTSLDVLDRRTAAFEQILRARDEGLVRFVGVTGHNLTTPRAQAEAVRRYDLDTVMFPVNARLWADPDYRRDAEDLLALAAERDLGVHAIKAAAARPWADGVQGWGEGHTATTWYEPYTDPGELRAGAHFALSVPGVHAICTPGDLHLTRLAIEAAASFDGDAGIDLELAATAAAGEALIFPLGG